MFMYFVLFFIYLYFNYPVLTPAKFGEWQIFNRLLTEMHCLVCLENG